MVAWARAESMAKYTHLLDTSALLAHYFDESGAEEVDAIWRDSRNRPAICVLTVAELRTRLLVVLESRTEIEKTLDLYLNELTASMPVNREVAEGASHLRESVPGRLPLVDACIASCAVACGGVLVHRDPHMDQLSSAGVQQIRLPDR